MFKSIKKYCATTTILTPSIYSMENCEKCENCNKITNVQSDNNLFKKIKSNLRVKDIFDILMLNKKLNIIRYNKKLQTRLNYDISNYRPSVKAQIYLCNKGEKIIFLIYMKDVLQDLKFHNYIIIKKYHLQYIQKNYMKNYQVIMLI